MELLRVVTTIKDLPEHALAEGSQGKVLEELGADMVLVEFARPGGMAVCIAAIGIESLRPACSSAER